MKKRKIIAVVMSVMTVLLAVCLAAGMLHLYMDGLAGQQAAGPAEPVFTAQAISAMVQRISPVFWTWFACAVLSLLLGWLTPEKYQASRSYPVQMKGEKAEGTSVPRNAARLILFAAALVLLVLGIRNGGLRDVLIKAINICTECIGLG